MLRSDFVMKLMSAVLFVAIAAYIGLYIVNAADKKLVTTPAVRYTVRDSGSTEGFIIRSETLLEGTAGTVTLLAGEGEKVAAGQAVAVYYEGETALERASEIRALQLEIQEAETEVKSTEAVKILDTSACIFALSDAVRHRSFSDLQDIEYSVRYRVFSGGAEKVSDSDLAVLKDRLASLLSENSGTRTLITPMSGVFSSDVDGYETCTPEMLTSQTSASTLTPASLQALFAAPGPESGAVGKLITGITWYYAAVMDADDAAKLADKTTVTVQFTKTYNEEMDLTIESIGPAENGKCVVVFSSRRGLSETTALRYLTAEIEFHSLSGLLVPKEAVYTEPDGKNYIYLLTVLQAEKVYVEILSTTADGVIVRDGAENGTVLREGSEIIVKAEDLYDGKVVTG
jgi:hypothetical protein